MIGLRNLDDNDPALKHSPLLNAVEKTGSSRILVGNFWFFS
jgi:hypothetical protein